MTQTSPIFIVEDDQDDSELIQTALKEIGVENEQKCFKNGQDALKYLKNSSEKTFIIFSDINMPVLNGFDFKNEINSDPKLRRQSIPFVFLSTSASKKEVTKAYEMMAQGFFKKPDTFDALKQTLQMITTYWSSCNHPNSC